MSVMKKIRRKKLRSGSKGPLIRSQKQARATQLSAARKEGYELPKQGRKRRLKR